MRRELLLIGEMIDAAEQARPLVAGTDLAALSADRQRHDALLWNFTVLGEAATQLPICSPRSSSSCDTCSRSSRPTLMPDLRTRSGLSVGRQTTAYEGQ